MDAATFTSKVLGCTSLEIGDDALMFAITHYKGLDKQVYLQTDVADCVHLARRLTSKMNMVTQEDRVLEAIERLMAQLVMMSEFKESLRMVSDDLRKISAAAGLSTTKRKGNWKNKGEGEED
jgi:hypothetical protein